MMYCSQCGAALSPTDKFCRQCGTRSTPPTTATSGSTAQSVPNQPKNNNAKPLLTLKPYLIVWVILARYVPLQLKFTVLGGVMVYAYNVLYVLKTHHFLYLHVTHAAIYTALFFFFFIPLGVYAIYKRNALATRYDFYRERVEFYDGFWRIRHRVIFYKNITEMNLNRSMLQRVYGLCNITFIVPAMGSSPPVAGIDVRDVPFSPEMYEKIQQITQG